MFLWSQFTLNITTTATWVRLWILDQKNFWTKIFFRTNFFWTKIEGFGFCNLQINRLTNQLTFSLTETSWSILKAQDLGYTFPYRTEKCSTDRPINWPIFDLIEAQCRSLKNLDRRATTPSPILFFHFFWMKLVNFPNHTNLCVGW